jgi:WD40 repeat protein
MRIATTQCISVALLFTLIPCAPGQAPKLRTVLQGPGTPLALSHDGRTLVCVSNRVDRERGKSCGDFQVWDVKDGKVVASFQGPEQRVCALALSPDGATLASADSQGGIILWSMTDRKVRGSHRVGGNGPSPAFSVDGKRVGVVSQSAILICDTATGAARTSSSYRGWIGRCVFSPDLALVANSFHQDVDLLDTASGKLRRTLPDHHGIAYPAAFSADGKTLAVTVHKDDECNGRFTEIVLWDMTTGTQRACLRDVGFCYELAISSEGRRLVLLTETKFQSELYELRVIEAASGRSAPPVSFKGKQTPHRLSLSGDGKTFAVILDGTVQVYEMP